MSPVRLGDHELDLCGDVARVTAPSSKVKGPGVLAPPGRLLQLVDGAALAEPLGCHLLRPAVHRDALDADLDAELWTTVSTSATIPVQTP
jgi:hypothetical protein